MQRSRGFLLVGALLAAGGAVGGAWGRIREVAAQGDDAVVVALVPVVVFFLYLALSQAFRHDRLIQAGRADEIRDAMIE